MHAEKPTLSIRVKQARATSRWYGEHLKAYLLALALSFLVFGRLLFSMLRVSEGESEEPSEYGSAVLSDESLEASINASFRLTDMVFLGSPGLVDLPFLDSGSTTAVFPVTESTLDKAHEIMELLVSEESSIAAIIIVCPAHLVHVLQLMILGRHFDSFLDINLATWDDGISEGLVVMHAAARSSTEYVLVIGSEGFQHLHGESREHLLSHPLLLDVPTGFCGGNFSETGKGTFCVVPGPETQSASFLFPPFIIPTSLMRGLNLSVVNDATFWSEFGRTLAQTGEIGSFILDSDRSSDEDRCFSLCKKYGLASGDAQCSTDTGETFEQRTDPSQSSSLAIILPTLSDLNSFSSVACRLSANDYNVQILILTHEHDHPNSHDNSFPWLHDHLISSVCNISYSALHTSANDFANAEAVWYWLDSANETMSVIIYGSGNLELASELPFTAVLESQSAIGVTVIQIPQRDLTYCDWIGSLTLHELRSWHAPNVEISVITDNRPSSLNRLLRSLQSARYFGDSVSLRINVEQTADMETRKLIGEFDWDHGAMFVHHRIVHAGLLTAVVESWYPRSNHSYGVLLEDDVEISPLFYAWIKMALLRYRYGESSKKQQSLYGISLYQQKQIELRPEGRRPFDAQTLFDTYDILYRNTPYLSQIPCSWGAVYFPEHWREFHSYLMVRLSEAWLPLREIVVPHVRSNRWAKSWKKFFIELAFLRGYVMLYPNYDDFVSLSTNHLEVGSHVKEQPRSIYERKKALFTLPLMALPERADGSGDSQETGLLDLPEDQLPLWSDLPFLDLWGQLSSETEISRRGTKRQKELVGCTTIASQENHRRRPFAAEELFTCVPTTEEESEVDYYDDELDSEEIHYDI